MFLFKSLSHQPQQSHCETLWPTVAHQAKAGEQGEGLIIRKPIIAALAWHIAAVKSKVCALGIGRTLIAAKGSIGIKQALYLAMQVCGIFSRRRPPSV